MTTDSAILYVSTQGNDNWSGRHPAPNANRTDGPLATICKARDVVRTRKRYGELTGPVMVYLRGGRYRLSEPITFGPQDSAPVTYSAYPGEKPILDGGVRIEGWQAADLNGSKVWVAHLPGVAEGRWNFRQLFVNGERRQRPRLPKEGFYWMSNVPDVLAEAGGGAGSDTFQCAAGDIHPWRNLCDVDVVVPHYWVTERMPIASFDPQTDTVVSSRRSIFALKDDRDHGWAKYWVENVFEALCQPGEWYLDRMQGRLYYLPLPSEEVDTIEAYAPRIEYLLRLDGDPDSARYVEFLRFEGITFEHSSWYQPPGGGERFGRLPDVDYAAAPQAAINIPGAIQMTGAHYCAVEDCTIRHIGWYGVEVGPGCEAIRIVGNEMCDLGAGGVKVDGASVREARCQRTGNNSITDNHIHDGGHVFHSAVGIVATHTFGNQLVHNHIHDFYYTGVSCGWEWTYADSVSKDNLIEKNHIHHLGKNLLSDLGGIYTLGVQPGTVLRGNVIHDIEKWNYGGRGIYPDQGSSHLLIENNIVYDTASQPFSQHFGRGNIVRNNIFAFGREGQVRLSRIYGAPGCYRPEIERGRKGFIFERNIIVTDGKPLFVGASSAPLERCNFESDLNLIWDVSGHELISANAEKGPQGDITCITRTFSLADWHALGQDRHSIVADPRFRDTEHRDFSLMEDSPAHMIGFEPVDTSDVGPRPRGQRDLLNAS